MAYTPTEWKSGDVITAEKLNNMEEGIEDKSHIKLPLVHINITYGPTTTYECLETFEQLKQLQPDSPDFLVIVGIRHGADAVNTTYYYGRVATGYADEHGITIGAYQILVPASSSSNLAIQSYFFTITSDNTITCYDKNTSIAG